MHEKIVLPNGVRLLIEPIPHVHSASVGIWVGNGSRHETPEQQGISHMIEHMVFKGTTKRTAVQQAAEMDLIGGQFNAYTTKEITCYYTRALHSHLPLALDLLFDLFYNATFLESDIATEKNVILEEIGMYEDTPDDLCIERLFSAVYRGNALGRPILGLPSTLSQITSEKLHHFRDTHYLPEETVVSMAGRFQKLDVENLIRFCSRMTGSGRLSITPAIYQPCITLRRKEIEQNHLCLAFPALPYDHPKRFTMQLLGAILGGSMSSRIFQEIRERLGLCYSTYTFGATHTDTGLLCLYAALSPDTEAKAITAICHLIIQLLQDGVTDDELYRAREQAKSSVFLGLESVTSRMNHLARSELFYGKVMSERDILEAYDAITCDEILALARRVFDFQKVSLSVVGQVGSKAHYQTLLQPFMQQTM